MKRLKSFLLITCLSTSFISFAQDDVNVGDSTALDVIKALTHYNTGIEKFNAKDFQNAIIHFDSAITITPNYEKALFNRGSAKFQLKDYKN